MYVREEKRVWRGNMLLCFCCCWWSNIDYKRDKERTSFCAWVKSFGVWQGKRVWTTMVLALD